MKKLLVEEWVLKHLWAYYPEGAAKNQLSAGEMAVFIRKWALE